MAGWKKPLAEDVLQSAPPTPSPIQEREKDYKIGRASCRERVSSPV